MRRGRSLLEKPDVFILCGGFGKRLGAITRKQPKPLLSVCGEVFLARLLRYLSSFGMKRFILGVGYKGHLIEGYFREHKDRSYATHCSFESRPLDTGGAVKNARRLITTRSFLVLNGDSYCRIDYRKLLRFHRRKKALVTMVLVKSGKPREYGAVSLDRSGAVMGFQEKVLFAKAAWVSAGIYVFDKKVFSLMPSACRFSLEKDFFPRLAGHRFFGYTTRCRFIDIGTPSRLKAAPRVLSGR